MSRFLLVPGNNTLSHVAKCLLLRDTLSARGHEARLAVSAARAAFLDRLGETHYFVLPDIQEADLGPYPTFSWFRPERVAECIRAEMALLRQWRPDAMLGVFRFTGALSARLVGMPYASLVCGAVTPACTDVLGFAPDEEGASAQAAALGFFRRSCASRMAPALADLGLASVQDIWSLLEGDRTFLWDTPDFQPLPAKPGYFHVGPLLWTGWPSSDVMDDPLDRLVGPMAYVAFGTGRSPGGSTTRLVSALLQQGYSVALALGGQARPSDLPDDPRRVAVFDYLPAVRVLDRVSLVVCHGGQNLIFEALGQRLPILILPLQPEQAQNGLCLERLGCGRRLLRGQVFTGCSAAIEAAFLARPADEILSEMTGFLEDVDNPSRLAQAASRLSVYGGCNALAAELEALC